MSFTTYQHTCYDEMAAVIKLVSLNVNLCPMSTVVCVELCSLCHVLYKVEADCFTVRINGRLAKAFAPNVNASLSCPFSYKQNKVQQIGRAHV